MKQTHKSLAQLQQEYRLLSMVDSNLEQQIMRERTVKYCHECGKRRSADSQWIRVPSEMCLTNPQRLLAIKRLHQLTGRIDKLAMAAADKVRRQWAKRRIVREIAACRANVQCEIAILKWLKPKTAKARAQEQAVTEAMNKLVNKTNLLESETA